MTATASRLSALYYTMSRLTQQPMQQDSVSIYKVNDLYYKIEQYKSSDTAKFQLLSENLNKLVQCSTSEYTSFYLLDYKLSKYVDLVYASASEAFSNEISLRADMSTKLKQLMQNSCETQIYNIYNVYAQREVIDKNYLAFMRENMTKVVEQAYVQRQQTDIYIAESSSLLDQYVQDIRNELIYETNERETKQVDFQDTLSKVCEMLYMKLSTEREEREKVEDYLVGLMELICYRLY